MKQIIQPIEIYLKGLINAVLLSAGFMDFLDSTVRIFSVAVGIVLTIFLIRKAHEDYQLTKEKRKGERIKNEMAQQELFERRLKNLRK